MMTSAIIEAVEGFWVPRPWLLAPVCPAAAAARRATPEEQSQATENQQQAQPSARAQAREKPQPAQAAKVPAADRVGEPLPAAPRIGIAQFFTREDPRSRRRGMRPYQAAHTLREGQALSSQGNNLVLSGRLRALPGSGVFHCISRSADTPPECTVSAEFLRVWIEKPVTREVIADWGPG